jgi:rhamnulokinase
MNRLRISEAEAFRRMSRADIYAQTGIQFMEVNTLYQLLAMVLAKSPLLEVARTFVTIPDLFNYWLTGRLICEFTNATTTQCFDPHRRDWARPLLAAMGVPESLFRPVTEPGTLVAPLHPGVAKESGASQVPVIAPACHDTGSAVAAVPAEGQNFAWISTGTWSILGTELDHPVISPQALQDNFTNEGGVFGTWRFSKNVMGLWIVQECRRAWARRGEDLSYDELTGLASSSQPFLAVIDPDDGGFLHPEDMPAQIREYCRRTGQVAPEEKGGLIRIVLESIALKYRWVLERLEEMTAMRFEQVHMIGGGTQNALLNQFTADATGRACLTGPVEATALGNMLLQAIALGHIASLADARRLIRLSFPPTTYTPAGSKKWDQAYHRLLSLLQAPTH